MTRLADLLAERRKIEAEIEKARREAIADLRKQIDDLLAENGLAIPDLYPEVAGSRTSSRTTGRPAVHRNPVTGEVWRGIGRKPKWLKKQEAERKAAETVELGE